MLTILALTMLTVHVGPTPPIFRPVLRTGFGASLAVGDGEVFVGEPANSFRPGMVFVYRKVGTTWQQTAMLTAPDSMAGDHFGTGIAVSGSDLFVSSPRGAGFVYAYRKDASGKWQSTGSMTAADATEGEGFGSAIAVSGDWLLVGAPMQTVTVGGTGLRSGSVYAYRRGANGQWSLAGKLPVTGAKAGDAFGFTVAVDGNRALVGAPTRDQWTGTVFAYQVDANGAWQLVGEVKRPDLQKNLGYGYIVRLQGDSAFISHPGADQGYGAVYLYRFNRDKKEWGEFGRYAPAGPNAQRFGFSLATDGGETWVGAALVQPYGRVYVYRADAAAPITVIGGVEGDGRFGGSLALKGNLGAVGAAGAGGENGNIFIYEREAAGWRRTGTFTSTTVDALEQIVGGERRCDAQGKVTIFSCKGTDLRSFLPVTKLTTGKTSHLSGMWGWTDPTNNREYAIVGRTDGTAFVDVTDAANPVFVGELPKTPGTPTNSWREIKTYQNYAFIVSEGQGHGMQVFDLAQLRNARKGAPPVVYSPVLVYDRVSASHSVVINEQSGFAYITGASGRGESCGGALHIVDIHDPKAPKFVGCHADSTTGQQLNGYVHDAQCVNYRGPDARYKGREVCLSANETAVSISDMTDKSKIKVISRGNYTNVGYAHQGWFTEDQRYWFMNDELDEQEGKVQKTRTIIWDMTDLEKPKASEFFGTTGATDHNLFIKGNLMYQSHYQAGLRIVDVSDPLHPKEVGFFDTAPFETDTPGFEGTWSNYPFFKSGTIAVASGNEGLFLVKKSDRLTP